MTTELRTESHSGSSSFAGKRIHFIGIGGCGMSGLAGILLDADATITGSDLGHNEATCALKRRGAKISGDQSGEHVQRGVDLVIRSAAVQDSNIEVVSARALGIPVRKYADVLGEVMGERFGIAVAGTHGKTTTTAMVAWAMRQCQMDPSFVIGGTVAQLGGSNHSGRGKAFVVEACEYDRSFHNFHPKIATINNIEADHLDYYGTVEAIIESFTHFAERVPADGLIIANAQDPMVVVALKRVNRRIEWVAAAGAGTICDGITPTWFVQPSSAENGCQRAVVHRDGLPVAQFKLQVPGKHNVFNATVAVATCAAAGIAPQLAADALGEFLGADRRMTLMGSFQGAIVIDDYGHHPTEIKATIEALRERYAPERLLCVFQPHQHSRTRTLMDEFATCFAGAHTAIILDIYAVRDSEEEKRLTHASHLVDRIRQAGQNAIHIPTFGGVVDYMKSNAHAGDLILTIGAGNVVEIARDLTGR